MGPSCPEIVYTFGLPRIQQLQEPIYGTGDRWTQHPRPFNSQVGMDKYMTELQLTQSEQSFMQATERKNLKSAQCLIENI